jgi:hypothetical protein
MKLQFVELGRPAQVELQLGKAFPEKKCLQFTKQSFYKSTNTSMLMMMLTNK